MTDLRFFTFHLLTILFAVSSESLHTDDYCSPEAKLCESVKDHTMCKYPEKGLSDRCTPGLQEDLTYSEKKRILFWHNKFRSNVATASEKNKIRKLPTASNMRQLYWDDELGAIAERWASQCVSVNENNVYDTCRNTKRFQVSQNVGTRKVNGSTIDKQAVQMVIAWYKESKNFDSSLIDAYSPSEDDKASSEFSNLIWAETHAVGCARVIFQEKIDPDDDSENPPVWTVERLVCNYGPAGNQNGKPIYKRGVPCEECPEGTHCNPMLPGLCALQNEDKQDKHAETSEARKKMNEANRATTSVKSDSSKESKVTEKVVPENEVYISVQEETSTKPADMERGKHGGGKDKNPKKGAESNAKNPTKRPADYNSIAKDDGVTPEKGIRVARSTNASVQSLSNGDKCTCMDVYGGHSTVVTANTFVLMSTTSYFFIKSFF